MLTDAEHVNAVVDGNKEAFLPLVERYQRSVRAIAMQIRCDPEFAADVTQQAFLKAFEKLSTLKEPRAFGAWLLKSAKHYAIKLARQDVQSQLLQETVEKAQPQENGPLDEEKQALLDAVLKLPQPERQVVMLRYFSHMKVRQIADNTGRSIGTVTKQLSRAHQRLRLLLTESEK